MTRNPGWVLLLTIPLAAVFAACAQPAAEPQPSPQDRQPAAAPTSEPTTAPAPQVDTKATIYVFSDAAPHIVEIDGETHEIVRKVDVPEVASRWSWMDPDNYFDGRTLWGGTVDTDNGERTRLLAIDLDTLKVTDQLDLGPEKYWLYVGKPSKEGKLPVGIHGLWKVAFVDLRTRTVSQTVDVPVNAGAGGAPPGFATCDMDVSTGRDGVERGFYPTLNGNTVVSLNTQTGEVLKEASFPDARPVMLTAGPDGNIWVQETGTSANAILDHATLDVIARIPTGEGPVLASFSPDGRIGYIGNSQDTTVTVVDVEQRTVIKNVEVGANARMAAAHPNGKLLYVILTKENAVVVVDTATWRVVERIELGVAPAGLYVRKR